MQRFAILLAALALIFSAGCGRGRVAIGDGTVSDEDEPTAAVDLVALEHAVIDTPAEATPPPGLSQRLTAIAASAPHRVALLDDPAIRRAMQSQDARDTAESPRAGDETAAAGPASDRAWELKFPRGNTIQVYAQILDFFGIELGVLQPDGTIVYAAGLSKPKSDIRTGPASQEHRYYLTWTRGNLADADRQLLTRAGVDSRDKVVLQLLRPEMDAMLVEMEKSYAGSKANRVEKTRFGIRRKKEGYDIFVLDQTYKDS